MLTVLRYPGGKSRMLKHLTPLLQAMLSGEEVYCEPFVGGGSVTLCAAKLFPNMRLLINDKDPLVSSFWKVVCGTRKDVTRLIERLDVKPTVALWQQVKAAEPKNDLDRAFKLVFLNRTSFNGMVHGATPIGGMKQTGKAGAARIWKIDCQYSPSELGRLIYAYHTTLAGRTEVTQIDGSVFMQANLGKSHFVDPPYFIGSNPKKSLYGVDMTREEHSHLASVMAQTKRWILTYDFSDDVAKKLYYGNSMEVMFVKYSSTTAASGKWKKDAEIVAYKGFKATLPKA